MGIAADYERGGLYLWLIVGDIRQATDCCSNIWASLPGAGYVSFEHKADSLIAKNSKKRGRNGQRDWCMSRVTAIISALVICIIVCLSWAVNHYRDNAITYKAQREQKCQRTEAGECGTTSRHAADASAWCCCARCKIHEGAGATLKLKMMLCVMMLPLVVVGCTSKQSVSQCVKPSWPPADGRTDWQTPLNGIISPRERGWSLCKTTGRNPEVSLMSRDRVAHIGWATHAIIVSNTHALPAAAMPKVIKPSNPLDNVS